MCGAFVRIEVDCFYRPMTSYSHNLVYVDTNFGYSGGHSLKAPLREENIGSRIYSITLRFPSKILAVPSTPGTIKAGFFEFENSIST